MNNLIEGNEVIDSRDMVAWYSNGNIFRNNLGRRSRYSMHFMFANNNMVEGNRFYDNAVGIYFMYTEGGVVRNNVISHATGATGMGIGFKEASGAVIEGNEIIYCAVGIGSDLSPFQPDTHDRIPRQPHRLQRHRHACSTANSAATSSPTTFSKAISPMSRSGGGGTGGTQQLARQLLGRLPGLRPQQRRHRRHALRAVCLCRPDLDGNARRRASSRTAPVMEAAGFPRAPGALLQPDLILRDEAPRFIKPGRRHE